MAETERHVRLFRNGRNQAVRIPREFELEGDEAILRKEGDRLVIEPVRKGRLLALLASLEPLEETFPTSTKTWRPWTTWNFRACRSAIYLTRTSSRTLSDSHEVRWRAGLPRSARIRSALVTSWPPNSAAAQ